MKSSILIRLKDASFHSRLLTKDHSFIFSKPIDFFQISRPKKEATYWGIVGPKKSVFLDILASKFVSEPNLSRVYPAITDTSTQIQYLNFRENSGLDQVHLSARYESYSYKGVLEMSDDVNSVKNYVTGANNYNSNHNNSGDNELLQTVMSLFLLEPLKDKWINSLSNGQMRRARIAKTLMKKPKLLIIDDPFLGLDPSATNSVSDSLNKIAAELNIGLVVGLRIQDQIPSWITHIGLVDELGLRLSGKKDTVVEDLKKIFKTSLTIHRHHELSHLKLEPKTVSTLEVADPIIEFENASVIYRGQPILRAFDWKVQRGSKWRILGDNGSGKTTLLSLITADHPQSWRSVVKINGRLRKTGSGVNYFDINDSIGISSPEVHALVPRSMTTGQVIMNGLVPGIGNSNFKFKYRLEPENISAFAKNVLDLFYAETDPIWDVAFQQLTVSQQKLALFLRAVLKNPEVLILDEAFSCMDDEVLMMKCHAFVSLQLTDTTVLAIGHIDWELPTTDYTLHLKGDADRSYSIYNQL